MKKLLCLIMVMVAGIAPDIDQVSAQGRGAGPPAGVPGGGRPVDPGRSPGGLSDFPGRGRPAWADQIGDGAATGLEHALAARRLAEPEKRRAEARVAADPTDYELDRNGALAIRGEVLALGLNEHDLSAVVHAGFVVERCNAIASMGTEIIVLRHDDMSAEDAAKALRHLAPTAVVSLNHVLQESGGARQPIKSAQALPVSDQRSVQVGMIDTAVSTRITSSRVKLVQQNFAGPADRANVHGTAVAAILARGERPTTIYAADIFGAGPRGGTSELLVRALGWMADRQVPVINVSMVGPANPVVGLVTERMIGLGFTIVAPVGNDGSAAQPLFPASYPGVVAVTATNMDGALLPEASRVARVDFAAPGIANIEDPAGRPIEARGTSFAAPVVSRLLAYAIRAPDRKGARDAISQLARVAAKPSGNRKWYGHGLIGLGTNTR